MGVVMRLVEDGLMRSPFYFLGTGIDSGDLLA